VDGELAVLIGELSPYVTAAVGAYGGAVLAKANTGERSIAAQSITGVTLTGDDATITR
jgi:hypothetical protein